MSRHGNLRRIIAALAGTLVLLIVPSSAAADTPISSSGVVGEHHLKDTMAKPGAVCRYRDGAGGGDQDLHLLRVKPPVIFAANTTSGRDRQLVGWRILVQRRDAGSSQFVTVHKGGIHTAWAWDDTAATLFAREYSVASRYGSDFRVRIKQFWYSGGGSVSGHATNEVDWYKKIYLSDEFGDDIETLHQYCPDYYPG